MERAKLIVEEAREGLWGLKTLVDLGEQQADNTSTPSSNPNPQQQPFLLSGLSIDKIYWHVVQIKLIKARQKFIEMRIMLENICQPAKKSLHLIINFFLSNTKRDPSHVCLELLFMLWYLFIQESHSFFVSVHVVENFSFPTEFSFSFAKLVHISRRKVSPEKFGNSVFRTELHLLCHS